MTILDLDRDITVAINSFRAEWADGFFYYVSQTWVWTPLAVLLLWMGWRRFGWRHLLVVVACVALCILLSDQLCNLVKHTVCRLRPSHEPSLEGVIHTVDGYVGGMYGFCSAHAANTTTVALFTSLVVRRRWYWITAAVWVVVNCWSRIYLGVHYFGDIVCGILLGAAIAIAIAITIAIVHNSLTDRYKQLLEK